MDIILELGGNVNRMKTVRALATRYQDAKIIISSEIPCQEAVENLTNYGIEHNRFLLDYAAWDTVTNFTKTYGLIKSYKPEKIYVVTDKFHMQRAMAIASAIYFTDDILLVPCLYMGGDLNHKEPFKLVLEDFGRAAVWKLTKKLIYDKAVKDQRWPSLRAEKQKAISLGYPVTAA